MIPDGDRQRRVGCGSATFPPLLVKAGGGVFVRAVICASALLASSCGPADTAKHQPAAAAPATAVDVVRAAIGPIHNSLEVAGVITPLTQATVLSGADGRVARVRAERGTVVRKGQPLFDVERRPVSGAAPVKAGGSRAIVRSPLAGVVVVRRAAVGDAVLASRPTVMATVADIDLMVLRTSVPPEHEGALAVGQEATVGTETVPGETFAGRVAFVAPRGAAPGDQPEVEIIIANPGHTLMPGMTVRASVVTAFRAKTLLLPAPTVRDGRLLVVADGVLRERAVQVGLRTKEQVEVLSGISLEDLVAVPGPAGLTPGTRVTARQP